MPPKAKISREMILEAAFQIARTQGADQITARSISQQLNCSTQPILYYFASVADIKAAVYERADEYHSCRLMNTDHDYGDPLLNMGMNYIRFAVEEGHLFRFLFQSNEFSGDSLADLVHSEGIMPVIQVLRQEAGVTAGEAAEIFTNLFIFVHGYASLFANNEMACEEDHIIRALTKVYSSLVTKSKVEMPEKDAQTPSCPEECEET